MNDEQPDMVDFEVTLRFTYQARGDHSQDDMHQLAVREREFFMEDPDILLRFVESAVEEDDLLVKVCPVSEAD